MSVCRLLASGSNDQLIRFHVPLCMKLNSIERRQQTVLYTCMESDLQAALDVARTSGVTLQSIEFVDDVETYPILIQGQHPGWKGLKTGS